MTPHGLSLAIAVGLRMRSQGAFGWSTRRATRLA